MDKRNHVREELMATKLNFGHHIVQEYALKDTFALQERKLGFT